MLGFFDLQQVQVMKGPQALFFGKNSPAGVIAITSAGPTRNFEAGATLSYEFVGDELGTEGYISGPLTDTLGARLAVKYRNLEGWLYNNAEPIANPFYRPNQPAGAAMLPGARSDRIGDSELLGRLTLEFKPTNAFTSTLKLTGMASEDQSAVALAQNIGPCVGGPRSFGIVDPFGDCDADNQTSYGSIPDAIAATLPRANGNGRVRGKARAIIASWTNELTTDQLALTSVTGYFNHKYKSLSTPDQTVFIGLIALEETVVRSFSQEFRALTDWEGPVNLLAGAYFQDSLDDLYTDLAFRGDLSFNPINGRYSTVERIANLKGRTYSVFGQVIWDIFDEFEIAAGARWTKERKTTRNENLYGVTGPLGRFDISQTVFPDSTDTSPGVLAGNFSDENISPEVTVTWMPAENVTIYAAYKTGFKSGGFGLSTPTQTSTRLADLDFESETVEGFEAGAKLEAFGRRLRLTGTAFAYDFQNLQVTTYDAAAIRFQINNAGEVRQRGIEFDGDFKVSDNFRLRGAVTYVKNRIKGYTGQCYGFPVPASAALTAIAPDGCSFVTNADGTRFISAAGTPILQQVNDGRPPARSPDWAGNFGASAHFPLGEKLTFGLTGDAFFSGGYYASDAYSPQTYQSSFWRFNASARVGGVDDRWEVALIGRNLTNKNYLAFATDRTGGASVPLTPGEQRGVASRGREVAVQASFRF